MWPVFYPTVHLLTAFVYRKTSLAILPFYNCKRSEDDKAFSLEFFFLYKALTLNISPWCINLQDVFPPFENALRHQPLASFALN